MAGRVHGRVRDGRVFILSDRALDFAALRPVSPEFQLAGDSERVALTCAALGVRADELDLPVPLERVAYREALATLESRGIVEDARLTQYGKAVEAMPCDRPWAELLVHCDDDLLPALAVDERHRVAAPDDARGAKPRWAHRSPGATTSPRTTCTPRRTGGTGSSATCTGCRVTCSMRTSREWGERRGVLVKSIEDAALAMASVYRALRLPLPSELPPARDGDAAPLPGAAGARPAILPRDRRGDGSAASPRECRRRACAGAGGRSREPCGTSPTGLACRARPSRGRRLPRDLVRKYAVEHPAELVFDAERSQAPLRRRRRVTYFGFELEREDEPIRDWRGSEAASARRVLADALARGEALHPAVRRHRQAIDEIREAWRRSGGTTPRLGQDDLAALYERALDGIDDVAPVACRPAAHRLGCGAPARGAGALAGACPARLRCGIVSCRSSTTWRRMTAAGSLTASPDCGSRRSSRARSWRTTSPCSTGRSGSRSRAVRLARCGRTTFESCGGSSTLRRAGDEKGRRRDDDGRRRPQGNGPPRGGKKGRVPWHEKRRRRR